MSALDDWTSLVAHVGRGTNAAEDPWATPRQDYDDDRYTRPVPRPIAPLRTQETRLTGQRLITDDPNTVRPGQILDAEWGDCQVMHRLDVCVREKGHEGQHVASGYDFVRAVWS